MKITEFADLIARAEGKKKSVLNAAQAREVFTLVNCALGHGSFYWLVTCQKTLEVQRRLRRRAQRTKRGAK